MLECDRKTLSHVIKTKPINKLREVTHGFEPRVQQVVDAVLRRPDFLVLPASIDKHHAFTGGLLQHTVEVVDLALHAQRVGERHGVSWDRTTLFLAAVLHDIGKVETYILDHEAGRWGKVPHHTKRLHIEKGIGIAVDLMRETFSAVEIAPVVHCIGAHHGRIDYGALWEPATREAWALHLADMTSVFGFAGRRPGP